MYPHLQPILASFQGKPDELIPILQQVQEAFGYLPREALSEVARLTGVPDSSVYGVATFYSQFRLAPLGKRHIVVCRGTSCHVRGARRILQAIERELGIQEGQTTPDREYSLETAACLGVCGLSPCLMVNKKVEANVTPATVRGLLQKADGHVWEPR
jgi:NADH-quinone oxidoreductase subunit E